MITSTPPDLCEMGIVANATGLSVDRPGLHAPVARTLELPLLFRPREHGGLLARRGVVDMFNCFRRTDELSFAGGVFVTVEVPDGATGRLLAGKGLPASPDGRWLMLHNPVHLLGLEALMSVLSAVRLGVSTGGTEVRPRVDLVARAIRALVPGEHLVMGPRHTVPGLEPLLLPSRPLTREAPVPYYMAVGCRLRRAVPAGEMLTLDAIEPPAESVLWRLRREQDALFAA
jgi:predicted homoserine dehydrogenase-like protein